MAAAGGAEAPEAPEAMPTGVHGTGANPLLPADLVESLKTTHADAVTEMKRREGVLKSGGAASVMEPSVPQSKLGHGFYALSVCGPQHDVRAPAPGAMLLGNFIAPDLNGCATEEDRIHILQATHEEAKQWANHWNHGTANEKTGWPAIPAHVAYMRMYTLLTRSARRAENIELVNWKLRQLLQRELKHQKEMEHVDQVRKARNGVKPALADAERSEGAVLRARVEANKHARVAEFKRRQAAAARYKAGMRAWKRDGKKGAPPSRPPHVRATGKPERVAASWVPEAEATLAAPPPGAPVARAPHTAGAPAGAPAPPSAGAGTAPARQQARLVSADRAPEAFKMPGQRAALVAWIEDRTTTDWVLQRVDMLAAMRSVLSQLAQKARATGQPPQVPALDAFVRFASKAGAELTSEVLEGVQQVAEQVLTRAGGTGDMTPDDETRVAVLLGLDADPEKRAIDEADARAAVGHEMAITVLPEVFPSGDISDEAVLAVAGKYDLPNIQVVHMYQWILPTMRGPVASHELNANSEANRLLQEGHANARRVARAKQHAAATGSKLPTVGPGAGKGAAAGASGGAAASGAGGAGGPGPRAPGSLDGATRRALFAHSRPAEQPLAADAGAARQDAGRLTVPEMDSALGDRAAEVVGSYSTVATDPEDKRKRTRSTYTVLQGGVQQVRRENPDRTVDTWVEPTDADARANASTAPTGGGGAAGDAAAEGTADEHAVLSLFAAPSGVVPGATPGEAGDGALE